MGTAKIQVTRNGPYYVTGALPLRRRRPDVSEHDAAQAWESLGDIPAGETYTLCRCGGSRNKPFCDGTHLWTGFDGTETADTTGYDARAATYPGTGITVRDDRSICSHAGALSYSVEGHVIEPELRPGINVIDNGPLAVTGAVVLRRSDGSSETRARLTLCRCGASANKPFCDGSHADIGFHDAAEEL